MRESVRADDEQLRSLRDALRAFRQGDFSVRLPADGGGVLAEVVLAFNGLASQQDAFARELDRVANAVGHEGDLAARASLGPVGGGWAAAVGSVNALVDVMAFGTSEVGRMLDLVAEGDLSREMHLHVEGRRLQGELHGSPPTETDLALMDIMMPEIDGYEATRHIRSLKTFERLPFVALTAKASESDRARCLAAGMDDFVVKPAIARELVSAIAVHLRR